MSKKPSFNVSDSKVKMDAPLLDRLLERNRQSLKSEGIDLQAIATSNKNTTHWEQADEVYNAIAEGIYTTANEINDVFNAIKRVKLENSNELVLTVNTSMADLQTFTTDLLSIKKRHEGLSGVVKDGTELSLSMSVIQDYTILGEKLKSMAFMTMVTLTEFLAEARMKVNKLMNEEVLNNAQDPNVITDIQPKEKQSNV